MGDFIVHTNGIVIIDFLGDEEYKTGHSLFESYIKPTWTDCANIFYYHAPSKLKLINILNGVITAAKEQEFSPIVHIESHGSIIGMSTTPTGEERMTWKELSTFLVELNKACNFNLILITSSCHGANVISQLIPPNPAPFLGNVGPIGSVSIDSIVRDFGIFYKIFLKDFQFFPAFKSLNAEFMHKHNQYAFTPADYWFLKLYAEFVRTEGSKAQLLKRVDRVFNKITGARGLSRKRQAIVRKRLMAQMSDHQGYFEKFRQGFFMEKDCPGTVERFGITYEKVQEALNKAGHRRH